MVGGTIRRKLIHRESFRASVLYLLWQLRGAKITAADKCCLTTPSFLSSGTLKFEVKGWSTWPEHLPRSADMVWFAGMALQCFI